MCIWLERDPVEQLLNPTLTPYGNYNERSVVFNGIDFYG